MIFIILPAFYALRRVWCQVHGGANYHYWVPCWLCLLFFGLGPETDWSRLLPLGGFAVADLFYGILLVSTYSFMIVVLTLGPFCHQPGNLWKWMFSAYGLFC